MHAVMCVYVCGSGGGQMVEHAHARARTHIHTHMLPVDGGDRGEDAQAAGDLDGAWRVLLHRSLVCTVCVCVREGGKGGRGKRGRRMARACCASYVRKCARAHV